MNLNCGYIYIYLILYIYIYIYIYLSLNREKIDIGDNYEKNKVTVFHNLIGI